MSFGDAIGEGFFNYANFNGRASRAEYWWWMLFAIAVVAVAAGIDLVAFPGWTLSPFAMLAMLAAALPSLSVTVRRLHDCGQAGWWVLLAVVAKVLFAAGVVAVLLEQPLHPWEGMGTAYVLVPLALIATLGAILIVLVLRPGDEGNNRYGPNRYAGS